MKTENLDAVIEFCTENARTVSPYTTAFRRENRDIRVCGTLFPGFKSRRNDWKQNDETGGGSFSAKSNIGKSGSDLPMRIKGRCRRTGRKGRVRRFRVLMGYAGAVRAGILSERGRRGSKARTVRRRPVAGIPYPQEHPEPASVLFARLCPDSARFKSKRKKINEKRSEKTAGFAEL